MSKGLKQRFEPIISAHLSFGVGVLVVAAWMIILVNCHGDLGLGGLLRLAGRDRRTRAPPSTTRWSTTPPLNSGYLPQRWRLLEGVLAMAGLLTFAWSTGVLFMLAQEFQDRALRREQARTHRRPAGAGCRPTASVQATATR